MKFNKTTEIAVNLLSKLTDKPQRIEDLANQIGAPRFFTDHIVRRLRIAGLLTIKRGPNGGCIKSRQVNAWEVMTAFDNEIPVAMNDFGLVYATVKATLEKTLIG